MGGGGADDPGGRPLFLGWISDASSAAEAAAVAPVAAGPVLVGSFLLVALENRPEMDATIKFQYRVTIQVVSNLPLTSKQKLHFSISPLY